MYSQHNHGGADPSMAISGAMAKEHVGKIRVHMRTVSDEEVKSKGSGKGHGSSWHAAREEKYRAPAPPSAPIVENTGRWTKEEHRLFLEGLKQHGKEWKKIANLICTRTVVQIRTHAQKYFQKLAKICNDNDSGSDTQKSSSSASSSASHSAASSSSSHTGASRRKSSSKDAGNSRNSGVRRTATKRKKGDDAHSASTGGGRSKRQAAARKSSQRTQSFRPIDPKPSAGHGHAARADRQSRHSRHARHARDRADPFDDEEGGDDTLFPSADGWGAVSESHRRGMDHRGDHRGDAHAHAAARRQPFPHSLVMASDASEVMPPALPEVEGSPTSVMSDMNLFRFPTSVTGGVGHSVHAPFAPDSAANLFSLSGAQDSTGRRLYDAIATPGGTHPHQSTSNTLATMSMAGHMGAGSMDVERLREVLELDGVGEDLTIRTPDLSNFSRPGGSVLCNRGPNAPKVAGGVDGSGTVTPARSDSAAAASASKRRNNSSVKKHAAARSAMIAGYALSSSTVNEYGQHIHTVGNGEIPALTIAPAAIRGVQPPPHQQQQQPMSGVSAFGLGARQSTSLYQQQSQLHHQVLMQHQQHQGGLGKGYNSGMAPSMHGQSMHGGHHTGGGAHHVRHSSKDLDDMWNLATFDEDAFVSGLLD